MAHSVSSPRQGTVALFVAAVTIAGATACESVSVTAVAVSFIELSPATGLVHAGESLRLRVKLEDSKGNRLRDRPVVWSTADGAVASVDSTGLVQGVAEGETVVRAKSGRAEGVATITVRPRPISTVALISYDVDGGWLRDDRDLLVTVRVVDHLGAPVAGAGVGIRLTNVDLEQEWDRSGATAADGRVVLRLFAHPPGCYETRIVAVTASGLPWDGQTPENGYCRS